MAKNSQIGPIRKWIATALGIITLICAILFHLAFAFIILQVIGRVYENPILLFVALIFTFPPALGCTLVALFLVGPQECKLAWISLCSYPLFFLLLFIIGAIGAIASQH